jgi:hypothetical protein
MFAEILEDKRPAIIDRRYSGIYSQLLRLSGGAPKPDF